MKGKWQDVKVKEYMYKCPSCETTSYLRYLDTETGELFEAGDSAPNFCPDCGFKFDVDPNKCEVCRNEIKKEDHETESCNCPNCKIEHNTHKNCRL